MKATLSVLGIMIALTIVGCSTMAPRQLAAAADETLVANVMGKSTHFDIAGFGVRDDQFVADYNLAVADAFAKAPKGTVRLSGVKTFQAQNWGWNLLGGAAVSVGGSLATMYSTQYFGAALFVAGLPLLFVNQSDFLVVGEPRPE